MSFGEGLLTPKRFCSFWKSLRPFSSRVTISPSRIAVPARTCLVRSWNSGYSPVTSRLDLADNRTLRFSINAMVRIPSHRIYRESQGAIVRQVQARCDRRVSRVPGPDQTRSRGHGNSRRRDCHPRRKWAQRLPKTAKPFWSQQTFSKAHSVGSSHLLRVRSAVLQWIRPAQVSLAAAKRIAPRGAASGRARALLGAPPGKGQGAF